MAEDTTREFLNYDGLAYLISKLTRKIAAKVSGVYLPLTGGELTGDLKIGDTTIQASDGHIILPGGAEIY